MDDSLGRVRNHACEQISLSHTIDQYVSAIHALDFTHCPDTFTRAFKGHLAAWNNMKQVTDRFPNLRGEMHDLFDEIASSPDSVNFNLLLKNIWDTWGEVEAEL